MNKLFLIGNGFDLAHHMKTSYSDFLLGYINNAIRSCLDSNSNKYEDELIILGQPYTDQPTINSLKDLKKALLDGTIKMKCKHHFLNSLITDYIEYKWVDIEYEYFQELLKIYPNFDKKNTGHCDKIRGLNNCLDKIKEELVDYLKSIPQARKNSKIEENIYFDLNSAQHNKVLFLVFNYTETVKLYLDTVLEKQDYEVINIHGNLRHKENPIIFGYGDEMNKYYEKIEDLNENEFLRNMKSFGYFQTINLKRLNTFVDLSGYSVSIMGHSCGLSDRLLLNSIFCHRNCRDIRIFYHQRSDGSTDFTEKTFEISRHFKSEDKAKMRRMIIPLEESRPLS